MSKSNFKLRFNRIIYNNMCLCCLYHYIKILSLFEFSINININRLFVLYMHITVFNIFKNRKVNFYSLTEHSIIFQKLYHIKKERGKTKNENN